MDQTEPIPLRKSFLPLSRHEFAGLSPQEQVCYLTLALRAVTSKVDEVLTDHGESPFLAS
jgi:hypothetical protein